MVWRVVLVSVVREEIGDQRDRKPVYYFMQNHLKILKLSIESCVWEFIEGIIAKLFSEEIFTEIKSF